MIFKALQSLIFDQVMFFFLQKRAVSNSLQLLLDYRNPQIFILRSSTNPRWAQSAGRRSRPSCLVIERRSRLVKKLKERKRKQLQLFSSSLHGDLSFEVWREASPVGHNRCQWQWIRLLLRSLHCENSILKILIGYFHKRRPIDFFHEKRE